jgi:hypothetical protein
MQRNEATGIIVLTQRITDLRTRWRAFRKERLVYKKKLLNRGKSIQDIRKDRTYRQLKKRQHALTTEIKHLEKRLQKKINNSS